MIFSVQLRTLVCKLSINGDCTSNIVDLIGRSLWRLQISVSVLVGPVLADLPTSAAHTVRSTLVDALGS